MQEWFEKRDIVDFDSLCPLLLARDSVKLLLLSPLLCSCFALVKLRSATKPEYHNLKTFKNLRAKLLSKPLNIVKISCQKTGMQPTRMPLLDRVVRVDGLLQVVRGRRPLQGAPVHRAARRQDRPALPGPGQRLRDLQRESVPWDEFL